jgi:hypothetical protein
MAGTDIVPNIHSKLLLYENNRPFIITNCSPNKEPVFGSRFFTVGIFLTINAIGFDTTLVLLLATVTLFMAPNGTVHVNDLFVIIVAGDEVFSNRHNQSYLLSKLVP